jgi:hypothetical protein
VISLLQFRDMIDNASSTALTPWDTECTKLNNASMCKYLQTNVVNRYVSCMNSQENRVNVSPVIFKNL